MIKTPTLNEYVEDILDKRIEQLEKNQPIVDPAYNKYLEIKNLLAQGDLDYKGDWKIIFNKYKDGNKPVKEYKFEGLPLIEAVRKARHDYYSVRNNPMDRTCNVELMINGEKKGIPIIEEYWRENSAYNLTKALRTIERLDK